MTPCEFPITSHRTCATSQHEFRVNGANAFVMIGYKYKRHREERPVNASKLPLHEIARPICTNSESQTYET